MCQVIEEFTEKKEFLNQEEPIEEETSELKVQAEEHTAVGEQLNPELYDELDECNPTTSSGRVENEYFPM